MFKSNRPRTYPLTRLRCWNLIIPLIWFSWSILTLIEYHNLKRPFMLFGSPPIALARDDRYWLQTSLGSQFHYPRDERVRSALPNNYYCDPERLGVESVRIRVMTSVMHWLPGIGLIQVVLCRIRLHFAKSRAKRYCSELEQSVITLHRPGWFELFAKWIACFDLVMCLICLIALAAFVAIAQETSLCKVGASVAERVQFRNCLNFLTRCDLSSYSTNSPITTCNAKLLCMYPENFTAFPNTLCNEDEGQASTCEFTFFTLDQATRSWEPESDQVNDLCQITSRYPVDDTWHLGPPYAAALHSAKLNKEEMTYFAEPDKTSILSQQDLKDLTELPVTVLHHYEPSEFSVITAIWSVVTGTTLITHILFLRRMIKDVVSLPPFQPLVDSCKITSFS
eukprot:GHVH01006736.1.p1 GENE.GHVH01006736.1~~GHVH01006736.1.p1  ORF type:complete len:395 (+),score=25.49 GHVH01006736.1:168-1352(+)